MKFHPPLVLYFTIPTPLVAPEAAAARAYASVIAPSARVAAPARRAAQTRLGEMQAHRGPFFFLRHREAASPTEQQSTSNPMSTASGNTHVSHDCEPKPLVTPSYKTRAR